MRTVIAGSRECHRYRTVENAIRLSMFEITEVVSGQCRGVDRLGERWAVNNGLPIMSFPADWTKHKLAAGPIRNRQMAQYAEALILVHDGQSKGSKSMLEEAQKAGLKIYQYVLKIGDY